jgi:hypothetical protein
MNEREARVGMNEAGGLRQTREGPGRAARHLRGPLAPTFFLLGKVLQDLEATPEEQHEQARLRAARLGAAKRKRQRPFDSAAFVAT